MRDDHLWFLRSHDSLPGAKAGERGWCIDGWMDVDVPGLKNYFMAYRAADPRQALAAQLPNYPDRADRIHRYLDYLDAEAFSRIADPKERAAKLLPMLFRGHLNGLDDTYSFDASSSNVAMDGLIASGDPAGRLLLAELATTKDSDGRRRIIFVLGEMKYRPATDELTRSLAANNELWKNQQPRAFNPSDESAPNRRLRESFYEIKAIVQALGKIGERRAVPAIQQTLKRWTELGYGFITDDCDEAIRKLNGVEPKSEE